MTDEQKRRIWEIENSCDGRTELAERIVGLEDELAKWERLTAGIELPEYPISEFQPKDIERENAKLRKLLSCALISAGPEGRRFLDAYLQEDEGTTLWQELKSLRIEVD
jgi:hypothetical protein